MRESLVRLLACPACGSPIQVATGQPEPDGHVIEGELACAGCHARYPIVRGVPHLSRRGASGSDSDSGLEKLQSATEERFGFEWTYFRDWGWLEEYPDVPDAEEKYFAALKSSTVKAFWSKALFNESDLASGTTLDGGCGNGRFVHFSASLGTEVVGVDLGPSTYVAFEHTRSMPNVHIVRGDLFELPFLDGTFDRVFSIGVLQHTGDGPRAFRSLARKARPGGELAVCVYGTGGAIYEILDRGIRAVTTQVSIAWELRLAAGAAALARWLRRGGRLRRQAYAVLYQHFNLLPTEHHMFDWYSAPVAHHYDMSEVLEWFEAAGFEVLRTSPEMKEGYDDRRRRRVHASIAAIGRKSRDRG